MKRTTWTPVLAFAMLGTTIAAVSQAPAPRVSGTVKATSSDSLTVTNAAGQDVVVAVGSTAKVLQVAPGSKDLKSATDASLANVATGDKVLVTGTAGDAPASLHATRVVLMKSSDIAQTHAVEEEAWRRGGGGLVKAVDPASGTIQVTNAAKTITISTTPATKFRRYSGDSVRFEDATGSTLAAIHPGDQLRVRGTRAEDGSSIAADEIVTGSFRNFSGLLTAVNGIGETVVLKDLATGKVVTVKVTPNSDLRRLPAEMARGFAARAAGGGAAEGAPAAAGPGGGGQRGPGGAGAGRPVGPGGGAMGAGGAGSARAGNDLSQMLSRLPTETLGGLKPGDAVMIVATQPAADSSQATAITLLAGVEPILQASPKGEMVLSPWSVGSGGPDTGGGGGGSH